MAALMTSFGCSIGGNQMSLFNGKDLDGWKALRPDNNKWQVAGSVELNPENDKQFKINDGEGVLVNGQKGRTSNILSTFQHADCQLHIEFVVPKDSNSGVYFQGRYEVQVLDSYGKDEVAFSDCGGIYQRWINNAGLEGHAPRVNAALPPGQWQSFDVTFQAPRFDASGKKIANARFLKVVHNGKVVHENVELKGPTRAGLTGEVARGPLMLQGDHGPVAYRNIRIRPLN